MARAQLARENWGAYGPKGRQRPDHVWFWRMWWEFDFIFNCNRKFGWFKTGQGQSILCFSKCHFGLCVENQFRSVAQLCLLHGLQHFRFPCPSPTPGAYSNSCPLSWWSPSIFPQIRVFSKGSVLHITWPEYCSFSINPSNEYSGLISVRMHWLYLLAVQGTVKGLLQHHSSKASILWCSTIFIVQLSHPYITTRKTIALTQRTFIGTVMSLLFSRLSMLVTSSLLRSKCLLVSWLQSPSVVILEPKKMKSVAVSIVSPSICLEVIGLDAMILVFWMLSFKPAFSLSSFTFIKRLVFTFRHKGGVIWISEVTDISPGNLDSSLCFI